jgi:hypothetical protein
MAVAAGVDGVDATTPLQLMDALAGLRAGLVLAVHTAVPARASSHAAVSTATASASRILSFPKRPYASVRVAPTGFSVFRNVLTVPVIWKFAGGGPRSR